MVLKGEGWERAERQRPPLLLLLRFKRDLPPPPPPPPECFGEEEEERISEIDGGAKEESELVAVRGSGLPIAPLSFTRSPPLRERERDCPSR